MCRGFLLSRLDLASTFFESFFLRGQQSLDTHTTVLQHIVIHGMREAEERNKDRYASLLHDSFSWTPLDRKKVLSY